MFEKLRYWRWRRLELARRFRRRLRLCCALLVAAVFADLFYVAGLWPNWDLYADGPVLKSSFMARYEHDRALHGGPRLRWRPVPLEAISHHMIRSVLIGEDIRFYSHRGFDRVAQPIVKKSTAGRRGTRHRFRALGSIQVPSDDRTR